MNDQNLNDDAETVWQQKIKRLNSTVWDNKVNESQVERWLGNFTGKCESKDSERLHAYHLLQQFMYFGHTEIKELLKALYRDNFVYPTLQELRKTHPGLSAEKLNGKYEEELKATRFLGVGTPAESGPHLLYYFRQENKLPKTIFSTVERLYRFSRDDRPKIRDTSVRTIVYIDDFCGTGNQAAEYLSGVVEDIRQQVNGVRVIYLLLFATSQGLNKVRDASIFDLVSTVVELDDHYRVFSSESLYFNADSKKQGIDQQLSQRLMTQYGELLLPGHSLGYCNCQLLVGMFHNTPDNTLPAFWKECNEIPWRPVFPRYDKIYDFDYE